MLPRAILLLVLLGCVGCGTSSTGEPDDSASDQSPTPTASTSPPLSSTDFPTITPPTAPPSTPTDQIKLVTVFGTIEAVEPGCVQLVTDKRVLYALVGGPASGLRPGDTVKVRGTPAPYVATTCSGIVLRVRQVLPSAAR